MANINIFGQLITNLQQTIFNTNNINLAYYNMFFNQTPMNVSIEQYDNNGNIITVSIPNLASIRSMLFGDVNGDKINIDLLPSQVIENLFYADNEVEMLTLQAYLGNFCFRNDLNEVFMLCGTDPSILNNWIELQSVGPSIIQHNLDTTAHPYIQAKLINVENIVNNLNNPNISLYQPLDAIPASYMGYWEPLS